MNAALDMPLGGKAYGHIGHLPGSRVGAGDHLVDDGTARRCTAERRHDDERVVVQEKLDGCCMAVARIDGHIVPVTRAGIRAVQARFDHQRLFATWVFGHAAMRFMAVLDDGERLVGEWLALAHGTRYRLPHEPFVAFDLIKSGERLVSSELLRRVHGVFVTPRVVHAGFPVGVADVMARIEPSGHGAMEPVEGAVWRVERKNRVLCVAKYVRPDKVDGKYLPERGGVATWQWRP